MNLRTSDFTTSSWVDLVPCCGRDTAVLFNFLPWKAVFPSLRVACQYGTMFASYSFVNSTYKHMPMLKISPLWLKKKDLGKHEQCQQFMSVEKKMLQETQQKNPNLWSDQVKPVAFKMVASVRSRHHITWSRQQKTTAVFRETYSICNTFRFKTNFPKTLNFAFISYPIQGCRTLYNHNPTMPQNTRRSLFSVFYF